MVIRVVEVTKGLSVGGSERALVERLANPGLGFEYIILNVRPQEQALREPADSYGVRVVDIHSYSPASLARALRDLRPAVVNSHSPSVTLVLKALRARRNSWRLVETVHGIRYRSSLVTVLASLTANCTDANVAISDQVAACRLLVRSTRTTTVRLGVDTARIQQNAETVRATWRQQLDVGPDVVLVSIVAGFRAEKNHKLLVPTLKVLQSAGMLDRFLFILAGEGTLLASTRALMHEAGFDNSVRFLGRVDPGWHITAASDISLLLSSWEGVPLAIMEALACGTPVLAPAVGGIPEIVTASTGRTFPVNDYERIARELVGLSEDSPLRGELSRHCRAEASRWDAIASARSFEILYTALIS